MKSSLQLLTPGDPIRLRDGALPHVKIRNWSFQEIDQDVILVNHKQKGYLLEVNPEEIDWEAYRKAKVE